MKILSPEEIKKADAYTITHEKIRSVELMERAAAVCVKWMRDVYFKNNQSKYVSIFCGLGNNGGDGLAVARLLSKQKIKVEVFIVRYTNKCSDDFLINEKKLKKDKKVKITNVKSLKDIHSKAIHDRSSLIIDAIFGIGLNKKVEGIAAEVIDFINQSSCPVISIDIPSGLFCENNSLQKAAIRANHTLTFQAPKLSFLFPENAPYIHDFSVLDIGLNESFISNLPSQTYFITKEDIKSIFKPRNKFAHKGTFGHALVISGSYGKMGACVLASRACITSGAGLVTAHIPSCGYTILQTTNPEVMAEVDSSDKFISDPIVLDRYDAVGIGPGIGTEADTQNMFKGVIQNTSLPIVLDADALNILSENKTWLHFLPENSILTPHIGEFKRLDGDASNSYERLEQQKQFSIKYKVFVVLKGAYTCITCPDGDVYFNSTGNPGMATAGSGDVLTGIILGFLAQGYSSKHASILGVYLHGLAGDIAADHLSYEGLIARNIIESLPEAFKQMH